jgi:hypothetical protein
VGEEERRLFGPWSEKVLVERPTAERVGWRQSGIRAGVGVPFVQVTGRNIFENAAQKREAIA